LTTDVNLVLKPVKIKVNVKSSTCYSTSYMRQTQDRKCFTILEVAADWHKLMIACAIIAHIVV